MFAYYRTRCFGTATQRVLHGSLASPDQKDVVLVKNTSLQYCCVDPNSKENVLYPLFEQQAFGNVLDAAVLPCHWAAKGAAAAQPMMGNKWDDVLQNMEDFDDVYHWDFVMHQEEDDNCDSDEDYDDGPYGGTFAWQRKDCETRAGHTPIRGNHVLLLLSDYGQLVFCTVAGQQNDLSSTGRFECVAEVNLTTPGSTSVRSTNKKLAVDPWARAIAVAAYQDAIDVFIINRSMSRVHFKPIISNASIEEPGIICHLSFMDTNKGSDDAIVLVAVMCSENESTCHLVQYVINASNRKAPPSIRVHGRLRLDQMGNSLPLLFFSVPYDDASFVMEDTVFAIGPDDITKGNKNLACLRIDEGVIDKGDLCTAHSLPNYGVRRIYLGTDSGALLCLDMQCVDAMSLAIVQKLSPIGQQIHYLGHYVVDTPAHKGVSAMLILCVGESADSKVLALTENQEVHELQRIINRAPVQDAVDVSWPGHMVKLVLGSGQGNQGSLQSLSYDCDSIALDTRANWKGMTRLFCVTHESTEKEQFAYLVGSSSFDTKIAQLHQDPYEIWPPFVTDQPTILAQCASDFECVFQVLPRTVLLLHPGSTGPKARVDLFIQENNPELNVCFAAIHIDGDMNLVYLCCSDGKNCSVHLLTMRLHPLEKDDFAILDLAMVKEYKGCSPSAFSLLQFRDHIQLLIGTYSKQVHTLVAGGGNWQPAHRSTRDVRCVPHSICLLGVAPDYILLASRDGKILGAFIEGTNHFKVRFLPLFEPCKQPFTLTPMKKDGSVLASGEMLLYISLDTKLKHFTFNEVYTHGAQDHQDCVFIPRGVMEEEENGPSLHYESFCRAFYVAALTSDKMMIMKMQKTPSWTSRHVQLESTPTRLLVQKSCNRPLAIVALDADAQVGIGPQLQIIDQRDGEIVHVCELEDGSSVKCLAEWRIKSDSKTFDYVCVGIGLANRLANAAVSGSSGDNANKHGCLRIYQLTSKPGAYDEPIFSLQKVWQHDSSEGAINAVFQHKNCLFFAAGTRLHLYKTDDTPESLHPVCISNIRHPITSIGFNGKTLSIGTFGDSVQSYKVNKNFDNFDFFTSDRVSRSVHQVLMLDKGNMVAVTQDGNMVGMNQGDNIGGESHEQLPWAALSVQTNDLKTLFTFHYPEMLIKPLLTWSRMQSSLVNHQNRWFANLMHFWTDSRHLRHPQFVNTIVAFTVSGGMISVNKVKESLYTLLAVLERAILRYPRTQPFIGTAGRFRAWYARLSDDATDFKEVIHGDLIALYTRLTPQEKLDLICYHPYGYGPLADFTSPSHPPPLNGLQVHSYLLEAVQKFTMELAQMDAFVENELLYNILLKPNPRESFRVRDILDLVTQALEAYS